MKTPAKKGAEQARKHGVRVSQELARLTIGERGSFARWSRSEVIQPGYPQNSSSAPSPTWHTVTPWSRASFDT